MIGRAQIPPPPFMINKVRKMGMFDVINFEMPCPFCGETIYDFQTKDMGKSLSTYELKDVWGGVEFYSSCHKCKTWVSITKRGDDTDTIGDHIE